MKKSILLLAAICAIPFMSCKDDNDESESSAVLCPFAVGNTWTYKVEGKYVKVKQLTQTIEKSYTDDGKTGFSYDKDLSTDNGFALRNTDSDGSIVELRFKKGHFVDQSVIYKKNAKEGETYKAQVATFSDDDTDYELEEMNMTCVKRDTSITVAAGTFNCICYCMTVYDDGELSDKFYEYYAYNVGLIKNTRYEFPTSNKSDSVMMTQYTLSSYQLK